MKLNDGIIKYRPLWALGVIGFFGSIIYTIITNDWLYWLISYLYFRILWFFTNGIGLHRYFAHKSFKTGPLRHKFLAWITVLGGVGSPFTWTIHHRHHHRYSDTTNDLHSPKNNKFLSFSGLWAVKPWEWWEEHEVKTIPKDLYRDSTVMFITEYYYRIWTIIFVCSLLIGWKFCLFFVMAPIGWNLFHGALNNFFNHMNIPGSYRNYETADNSQNHTILNWYLLGEGLHNNHHANPGNYQQAHKSWEFDLGAWVIKHFFDIEKNNIKST